MRIARVVLWSALLAATTPPVLMAQAARGQAAGLRCGDGTVPTPGYTACWFHGGVASAAQPAAASSKAKGVRAGATAAQPAASERCGDGTSSEPGVTACWFHGGIVAPPKAAAATSSPSKPAAKRRAAAKSGSTRAKPTKRARPATAAASTKAPARSAAKPTPAARVPAGSTARCKDGTYTDAKKPAAGCKKHKGVARTL